MIEDVNQLQPAAVDRERIISDVRRLIHLRGLKQASIARETGIAASALSRTLQGKYGGDDDAIIAKLAAWLANLHRRDKLPASLISAPKFVQTRTAEAIINTLALAQLAGDVALIAGASGVGKTHVLQHYAETRPNAWIATMSADTEGPVPMLEEIGIALGLRQIGGGAARMRRDIEDRVRNTGGLLMVDECQDLSVKSLLVLKRIYDTGHVALALCGDLTLKEKLQQHPHLFNRIGKNEVLIAPTLADTTAIADAFGVHGEDELEFLHKTVAKDGIRRVVKVIRLAFLYAGDDSVSAPNVDHLRAAWANSGVGEAA